MIRTAIGALALAAAFLASGCGGEPKAQSWAGDVCSEVDQWVEDIRGIAQDAEAGGNPLETYRARVGAAEDATRDLADGLADVGAPDTEAGNDIEEELQALADELRVSVSRIRTTTSELQSGSLSAFLEGLATIAAEVERAGTEIAATFSLIVELDPAGARRDGFRNADSCKTLRENLGDSSS